MSVFSADLPDILKKRLYMSIINYTSQHSGQKYNLDKNTIQI